MRSSMLLPAFLLLASPPLHGAEITLVPSVTVSEEYNDNIHLTSTNTKGDFVTRVSPAVEFSYQAPFWKWQVNAGADYIFYAGHELGAKLLPTVYTTGKATVIENFFYVDVTDYYHRIPLAYAYDSLLTNQVDQNLLTVTPYLLFHPTPKTELMTGYRYKNALYNVPFLDDWQEHALFLRATHQTAPKLKTFVNLDGSHTTTDRGFIYNRVTPSGGIIYNYARDSHVRLEGGYSLLLPEGGGGTSGSPYWDAEIVHADGPTTYSLNTGVVYHSDPFRSNTERWDAEAGVSRKFPRGSVGLFPFYSVTRDNITRETFQKSYGVRLKTGYDVSDRLAAHFNSTAGRYHDSALPGTVYVGNQFFSSYTLITADAGITYKMSRDMMFFCSYLRSDYLFGNASRGDVENNRFVVGITKRFQGFKF